MMFYPAIISATHRYRCRFLWFPMVIDSERRWLIKTSWIEQYIPTREIGMEMHLSPAHWQAWSWCFEQPLLDKTNLVYADITVAQKTFKALIPV